MFYRILLLSTIVALTGYSFGDGGSPPTGREGEVTRGIDLLLGTRCGLTIYEPGRERVITRVFSRVREIELKMSRRMENSEVRAINRNSGIGEVAISDSTWSVINTSLRYSKISDGGFDISIGPLIALWEESGIKKILPPDEEIKSALNLTNYKNILMNKEKQSVFLKNRGMIIDLGGIAKGYAVDEAVDILAEENVKHAIIDFGGNIYAYGVKKNGKKWRIGIRNPDGRALDYIGIIEVSDKAIATSGGYERFVTINNKHYHHILDSKNGYPVESGLLSASIISKKSIDADTLSTVVFIMGLKEGLRLIEGIKETEGVFITKEKEIYLTSGLYGNFRLTNNNFRISE